MSFRIPRRDTEIRFLTKFGGNLPLRSCWKVVWFTTQKNLRSAGLVPAPIFPKMGRSRPKLTERCHPLTCQCIPNLVRIGFVLPVLFRKDWFFLPKKLLQNNAPYVSIRNRIKSAAMAPKQLRVAIFQQFSIKLVLKCQKRISWTGLRESSRL